MVNIVIDPSLIFLSQNEWENQELKDAFLTRLLDLLDFINEYKIFRIVWSDHAEEILWADPQTPPWKYFQDFNLKIIPIYYNKLRSNYYHISVPTTCSPSTILTEFDFSNCPESFKVELLLIIEKLIIDATNFEFYLGFKNLGVASIEISSNDKTINKIIAPSQSQTQLLASINITDFLWPKTIDSNGKATLNSALDLMRLKTFSTLKFLYKPIFSNNFIDSLINVPEHKRENIVYKMVRRLTLNTRTAEQDASLQDEKIKGISFERRFRITARPTSNRIQYISGSETIEFLKYFGDGEHDDGLP